MFKTLLIKITFRVIILSLFQPLILFSFMFTERALATANLAECRYGRAETCNELGMQKERNGEANLAIVYYRRACSQNYILACFNLSLVLKDMGRKEEAYHLLYRSCEEGILEACGFLGKIEEQNGRIDAAIETYKKACANGDSYSCGKFRTLTLPFDPQK